MCYRGCFYEDYNGICTDEEAEDRCNDTTECVVCGNMNNYNDDFDQENCGCYKCAVCDKLFETKDDCYDDGMGNLCVDCYNDCCE